MIRNHKSLLKYMRDNPVPAGHCREWYRDGFVMAVDMQTDNPETVTQVNIIAFHEEQAKK